MSETSRMGDELTDQLASSGPAGVAAAAAIASARERNGKHAFERDPKIRKRVETRLLRRLRQVLDEFSIRVGQQAAVVIATPGRSTSTYKVFGSRPLEDVMKNYREEVMEALDDALADQAPTPKPQDPSLFELPPLLIDGIPTHLKDMTQYHLRNFIPLMLKYSTGRGKPGYGQESKRPPWWPMNVPWANVRMDTRNEEDKQRVSWTRALRQIIINCYKFHRRMDLLPAFSEEENLDPETTEKEATLDASAQINHSVQNLLDPDYAVMKVEMNEGEPTTTLPDSTVVLVEEVAMVQNGLEGEVTINKYYVLKEGFVDEAGQIIVMGHTMIPISSGDEVPIQHYFPVEGGTCLSEEEQATTASETLCIDIKDIQGIVGEEAVMEEVKMEDIVEGDH